MFVLRFILMHAKIEEKLRVAKEKKLPKKLQLAKAHKHKNILKKKLHGSE